VLETYLRQFDEEHPLEKICVPLCPSGITAWIGGITTVIRDITAWIGGITAWIGGITAWIGGIVDGLDNGSRVDENNAMVGHCPERAFLRQKLRTGSEVVSTRTQTRLAAIDTNTRYRKMGDGHSTTKTGSIFSGESLRRTNLQVSILMSGYAE